MKLGEYGMWRDDNMNDIGVYIILCKHAGDEKEMTFKFKMKRNLDNFWTIFSSQIKIY